ncbi:MAG: EAL domain-containing protein, partial [Gammaproteobacteria bacterium]|nr:EAL domain-containing protein [Gammaproteobacteria bacterium]
VSQVDSAFGSFNGYKPSLDGCDFERLSSAVKRYRYIYSSAVTLPDGRACSSYGEYLDESTLPVPGSSGHFKAKNDLDIWFFASKDRTADAGEVIVSNGDVYLWLNKGILLDMLSLPLSVSFDLVDARSLLTVFSNDLTPGDYSDGLNLARLVYSNDQVYYASSDYYGGIDNLVPIFGFPYIEFFVSLYSIFFLVAIVVLLALYSVVRLCCYLYDRFFSIQAKFRQALKYNLLYIMYQPIVDVRSSKFVGAEALLRWSCDGQAVSPDVFIPLAQSCGLMSQTTRWVCEQVFRDYARRIKYLDSFYVSINLSAGDVEDKSFATFIDALRLKYSVPASAIVFEITEGHALDKAKAVPHLEHLSQAGHLIAIDDFGTGYSNLSYLEDMPVDILKLDRSFMSVEKMSSIDSIWWHVVSMARTLELKVIAEGIECSEQLDCLCVAGVGYAQGWYFSRPLSAECLITSVMTSRIDLRLNSLPTASGFKIF